MLYYRSADNLIRAAYWIAGLLIGGLASYFTRYYLNTDGLIYLEIGDAVRRGNWGALVNHQWSPAYSVILGFVQWCLNTTLDNELTSLKIVNFFIFVSAMGACEVFIKTLDASFANEAQEKFNRVPFELTRLALYCAFLLSSLVWIRVRLMSPDMLMFTYLLLVTSLILRIKMTPEAFSNFVFLGSLLGLAYLTKTYMFVYSAIVILLGAFAVGNLKKAIVRAALAAIIMMAFSSPLIVFLSRDLGRFTYGEAGNYNYALFVAGQGEPIKPPHRLTEKPETLLFEEVGHSSFSPGADIAKRNEGIRPRFDFIEQMRALHENLRVVVSDSGWIILAVFMWSAIQLKWAKPRIAGIVPPSIGLTLLVISITGLLMFALVLVEMRYIAPFLFFGFAGLLALWDYKALKDSDIIFRNYTYYAICIMLLSITVGSVIDQVQRALCPPSPKQAYETVFEQDKNIARFFNTKAIAKGNRVGVVESRRMSIYWARLAGAKIVAEITSLSDFVDATPLDRKMLRKKLSEHSIVAVVGRGDEFGQLGSEGWEKIPETSDYYLLVTDD